LFKLEKSLSSLTCTGYPKKGKATDYVARLYLGRLGKIDNGIVAVVSSGLVDGLTFPLMFEIYKPKERLKLKDSYLSKPQITTQMIREIKAMGFEIDYVLADSLYGKIRVHLFAVYKD
jgi:SRSO17 transposase